MQLEMSAYGQKRISTSVSRQTHSMRVDFHHAVVRRSIVVSRGDSIAAPRGGRTRRKKCVVASRRLEKNVYTGRQYLRVTIAFGRMDH
jgi:hypothetical protein